MLTSHEHADGPSGSGCGDHAIGDTLLALERPRWFARQIVGPEDLTQEQDYVRARMRRHNRMLHGWGVVCGLRVRAGKEACEVIVEPGYALDPCGEEIVVANAVSVDVCSEDMTGAAVSPRGGDPWCGAVRVARDPEQAYYLAIRYAERPSRAVLAYGDGCGQEPACEYSRLQDRYELQVLDAPPDGYDSLPLVAGIEPAFRCVNGARECPACPDSTWIVLADLTVKSDTIVVDCYPHRRHIVSFAGAYFGCAQEAIDVDPLFVELGSTVLADVTAGAVADAPRASVAVRLPVAGMRTLPVRFDVHRGETFAELLAREGERSFTADSGERFTLADAYAIAGVNPRATVENTTDALRPLEALDLPLDDLRVTRHALAELVDDPGMKRLADEHAGAPARVLDLAATDLMGVGAKGPLARRIDALSIGDVAGRDHDDFLATATARARGEARERLRAQAEEVWAAADRVCRLATAWARS